MGISSTAPSVFDVTAGILPGADGGDALDWSSIYFYIGLASSGASEAVENLQLLGRVHPGVKWDRRVRDAMDAAKELRETLQNLASAAYARSQEQQRETTGGAA